MKIASETHLKTPVKLDIEFTVPGIPRPQGSKRHVGNGRMVESSKFVANWRAFVSLKASEAMQGKQIVGKSRPIEIAAEFYFDRPKSHFKGHVLREESPMWHVSRPDVDKLLRALLDGMTGIVFQDDSQVRISAARKLYGEQAETKVRIWA